ncbi:MAG: cupin domain-containing protein [Candidatus Eremiobacteraeota bacterium]|nr:cupin domain-containing protein [Candidatus Eremiobacteraeota bacterium]
MQRLKFPDVYVWSQWQSEYKLAANSYFFVCEGGNAAVDPLEPDSFTHDEIARLGGLATIVVTTPDHERAAQQLAQRYGSAIISQPADGEKLFTGAFAMQLHDQQLDGEFAVHLPAYRAVITGDAIVGAPAGALSMLPDDCYKNPKLAALGLRKILSVNPSALLVGHGASIFSGAYEEIDALLFKAAGAAVHRINLDELSFVEDADSPPIYRCSDAEVGFFIGAQRLGYRVAIVPPGSRFCPLHNHALEEEVFLVLSGTPAIRTGSQTIECREGDFIAFPVGERGTHQLVNQSQAPAMVLLLARTEAVEANYYPDSDKLLVDTDRPLVRGERSALVRATPFLDYFDGE